MRSKVRIPLGANNSLGPTRWQSQSIIQSVWRGAVLRESKFYLTGLGTQSGSAFEEFLVIQKKKKKTYNLCIHFEGYLGSNWQRQKINTDPSLLMYGD